MLARQICPLQLLPLPLACAPPLLISCANPFSTDGSFVAERGQVVHERSETQAARCQQITPARGLLSGESRAVGRPVVHHRQLDAVVTDFGERGERVFDGERLHSIQTETESNRALIVLRATK